MTVITSGRENHQRPRRTRILLWIIYGLFTVVCLGGVAALLTHFRAIPFSRIIGLVFLLFGVFKILLAVDAYFAPRAEAPQSDQRRESGGLFNLWLSYKMLPGLLAVGVGLWALLHGVTYIDGFTKVHLM